jgi:Protein of unknown function (DUF732)
MRKPRQDPKSTNSRDAIALSSIRLNRAFFGTTVYFMHLPLGDPAALVGWAHWTCDQLAQGAKREHINIWLRQFNFSPGGDGSLDTMFIREAALYYCPEHKNRAGW